jgi:hypothetical protein
MVRIALAGAVLFAVAVSAGCGPQPAREEVLAHLAIDSAEELITRSGVAMDAAVTSDGGGAARIEATGPVRVRVAELDLPPVEDTRLTYRARLRSEGLEGRAYLEMWCAFPGQGEYFSRALHDPLTGSVEWVTQETSFFLEAGQRPSHVRLNLVIEGRGTVWLDDVTLARAG